MFSDNFENHRNSALNILKSKNKYIDNTNLFTAEKAITLLSINIKNDHNKYYEMLEQCRSIKQKIFNNKIFVLVPLYISNFCNENCLYCNFRKDNKSIRRKRLNDDELIKELEFLIKIKGYRTIELVYSSDPELDLDTISRQIRTVKNFLNDHGGGLVGLNSEAFDLIGYKHLKKSGIDFIVLWQETYDKNVYSQVHVNDQKKSKFEYRLDAYEYILLSGINKIGMGVLSGLTNWRFDWAMLILHQEYLRKNYSNFTQIIGIPRLKPASNAKIKHTRYIPNDDEFLYAIAIQGLYNPLSLPFINTREKWSFCKDASLGGGVLFTFDCKTIPGGYSLGQYGNQFPTFNFNINKYKKDIIKEGLIPIMKW